MEPAAERERSNVWSSLAGALAEGGWLAAMIVVAILFNTDTVRIFEEEKVYLFRSVALVALVALGAWLLERWRWISWRAEWRRPLVKPVAALGCAYLLSVPFSIAPQISFWGGYDRAQGAYTWLCYLVVFFAIVFVSERARVERLVATILLASLPLALYAVFQRFGIDPIAWRAESFPRVHSMAGNAIFLGAVLAMVTPLTLASVIHRFSRFEPGVRARNSVLTLAYLVLFGLQVLAVVYSQSRGPFLGLLAGFAIFLLAFAACTRRRWIALFVATAAVAGICFLVVFNLAQSPIAWLRNVQYIGRLGQIDLGGRSSTRVRVLVWQNVVDLLAAEPRRILLGYGPDALRFAFPRVRTEEISYHEHRNVVADRAHNEMLDALVMTGLVGLAAEIVLFVALFYWIIRWLGLLRSPPQRVAFFCFVLGGGVMGVVGALVIENGLGFAGVLAAVGMTGGIFLYLFAAAIGGFGTRRRLDPDRLLLIALFAGVVAHFVEIQVGIAVVATRLYFFVYAALAAVVGGWRERGKEASDPPVVADSLTPLAVMVGLILIILSFDFYRQGLDLRQHGLTLGGLFASVWGFGLILAACDSRAPGLFARVISFASTSVGVWILFVAVYLPRAPAGSVSLPNEMAAQVSAAAFLPTQAVTLLYASVFVVLLLYAGVTRLSERTAARPSEKLRLARGLLYAGALGVALMLAFGTNLQRSRADVLAAQAVSYESSGAWQAAAIAYSLAEQEAPGEERYGSQLGFALLAQAKRTNLADWGIRRDFLQRSLVALLRARGSNRSNLEHTRNLAKLHHVWSISDPDPEPARQHMRRAEEMYGELAAAMPNNAGLMNEWATLYIDHGDEQTALARLDESVRIDPHYHTTHWMRGNALMARGDYANALAAYDRTLELRPYLPAAMSGKTVALAAMGRTDDAIRVSQQAVERDGSDVLSRRNLISLLQQAGEPARALEHARAALPHVHGDAAIQLREIIAQLELGAEGQGAASGSAAE